jgi:Zn-finger nucleic acid-binding protein
MKCLNCDAEMTNNQVATQEEQIIYDICERCGSLWLDSSELDKMAFQVQGSIEYCEQQKDKVPEEQVKKCPRCDGFALDKVRFLESDDVFLHYCRNCGGFWLDGGELNLLDKELAKIMPVRGKGFSDFVNNVHVPYWFKRVKKPSSETDYRVAVLPIKGAEQGESTPDHCPACGYSLNQYSIFSMEFEGCPKCKGIWLVEDELRKLKNKVEGGSLRWLDNEIENIGKTSVLATKRSCVKCKTATMVSVIFGKSSVLVDWCPLCHGMWLDRGEFAAITDYLKHELRQMHPKNIENEAAADVVRIWSGGPESRFEEFLDAKAAVSALINATIFEHPSLFKLCMSIPRL